MKTPAPKSKEKATSLGIAFLLASLCVCVCANDQSVIITCSVGKKLEEFEPNKAPGPYHWVVIVLECMLWWC